MDVEPDFTWMHIVHTLAILPGGGHAVSVTGKPNIAQRVTQQQLRKGRTIYMGCGEATLKKLQQTIGS
jgi:hypothetical protein